MESIVQGAEFGLYRLFAVACDLEGLHHDVGTMVSHRSRRKFYAVADDIVLIRLDIQRVHVKQRVHFSLGHGERVVGEIDLVTDRSMKVIELLRDLAHKRNKIIIVVTHDLRLKDMADKVYQIIDGKMTILEK